MNKIFFTRALAAPLLVFLSALRLVAADPNAHLANLATRASTSPGDNAMIAGFAIAGTTSKQILIRAAGPSLSRFGVSGVLPAPRLQLFDSANRLVATGEKWDPTLKTTFTQAGAFAFVDNSRDAALLVTLAPGSYTAQISDVNSATGVALVEVYDLGPDGSRLVNLSTRVRVTASTGSVISSLVIAPGAGTRRLLIRAAGPALAAFNLAEPLADPAIALLSSAGQQLSSNDNWEDGKVDDINNLTTAAGTFPFAHSSKDAALVADLSPGSYSIQVSGVGNTSGLALVEIYDLTPGGNSPLVTVSATTTAADRTTDTPAVFTFTRSGDLSAPLAVSYALSGTAQSGSDFQPPSSTLTFPAGAATATLAIRATGDGGGALTKALTLTLSPGAGYNPGPASSASVTLVFDSGSLFITRLRPPSGAATTAYGSATVHLSSDEKTAIVAFNFANLSSPTTNSYLFLGQPGDSGAVFLFALPNTRSGSASWGITAVGDLSAADVVQALKAGRIFLAVSTANYPTGELAGTLTRAAGAQTFVTPPAPPALALSPISPSDAARFLTQATFGPRQADIDALTASSYGAWIDAQLAAPATLQRDATMADFALKPPADTTQPNGNALVPNGSNRQAGWFRVAVSAPDQLRQRVAFALSELFVISDVDGQLVPYQEAVSNYYDIFVRNGFGNYRQILEEVTLSPMMGVYLSHLRNARTDTKTGAMPDENYAREIMQLFSIGLNELLPDGTLRLDPTGQPIPSYDQTTITETARVFTGWSYYSTSASASFRTAPADRFHPMMLFPAFHDDGAKTIVGGRQLAAGQGGARDLADTLDTLFNHANTAPFIARQLIQRLVTSNPSPAYVYRVAQVFSDNGAGVRGDLGAVVRAILLDYEARSPQMLALPSYGKLKEPLLRVTALWRAADAFTTGAGARLYNPTPEIGLGQAAVRAPTVFNFFEPDYVPPGKIADAGLAAPEFQILNDTTSLAIPNVFHDYVFPPGKLEVTTIQLNLEQWLPLAAQPDALVDRANLIFTAGRMRDTTRSRILTALTALPANASATERVRTTLYLTVNSPDAAVQQ